MATRSGNVLLEVVLATAVGAMLTSAVVGSLATSRRVSARINARAQTLAARVRLASDLCGCPAGLSTAQGRLRSVGLEDHAYEVRLVPAARESLVAIPLGRGGGWVLVCGLQGSRRWGR